MVVAALLNVQELKATASNNCHHFEAFQIKSFVCELRNYTNNSKQEKLQAKFQVVIPKLHLSFATSVLGTQWKEGRSWKVLLMIMDSSCSSPWQRAWP